jgi:hypothetical protein
MNFRRCLCKSYGSYAVSSTCDCLGVCKSVSGENLSRQRSNEITKAEVADLRACERASKRNVRDGGLVQLSETYESYLIVTIRNSLSRSNIGDLSLAICEQSNDTARNGVPEV